METWKRYSTDAADFAADPLVANWSQVQHTRRHSTTRYMHVLKHRFVKQAQLCLPATMPDGAVVTFASVDAFERKKAQVVLQWWHAAAQCASLSDDNRVFARRCFVQNYNPGLFLTPSDQTVQSLKGPTCLLTYNGPWGKMNISELAGYARDLSPDELVAVVREHWPARRLFDKAVQFFLVTKRKVFHGVCVTAELCMDTYRESGVVRVHIHAWVDMGRKKNVRLTSVMLGDDIPHVNSVAIERTTKQKHSGAFYTWVDKIGSLWSDGNVLPYKHYAVRDTWITNMFATHKITEKTARSLYLSAISNAKVNVRNLEFVAKENDQERQEALELAARRRVHGSFRPWRVLPEVDAWNCHYECDLDRYRFLVLDGPSRMGKTRYCESLVGEGKALVVDCAGAMTPDLSKFARGTHELILFDEMSAKAVIANKKVFQASVDRVCLGNSQTNVNMVSLWLWKIRMVIASNCWKADVAAASSADAGWLSHNSVNVYVHEPLWEPDVSAPSVDRESEEYCGNQDCRSPSPPYSQT